MLLFEFLLHLTKPLAVFKFPPLAQAAALYE
jgi:hypothetical protein